MPELAQQIPIRTFIDHGGVLPDAEQNVAGTLQAFAEYAAVRAKGRHLEPKPGDRLPLKGVEAVVVSAAAATMVKPFAGAGEPTSDCGSVSAHPAQEPHENPRSTGFRLRFGRFRFLDLGDLTGPPLFALLCPNSLIGPIDLYLVPHHGGADGSYPATFAAFKPRVAIVNNGATKGGSPETFAALHRAPGLEDAWQLHRSQNRGRGEFRGRPDREPRRDDQSLDQGEREGRRIIHRDERPHRVVTKIRRVDLGDATFCFAFFAALR